MSNHASQLRQAGDLSATSVRPSAPVFVPKLGPSRDGSNTSRAQTPEFRPDPTAAGFRMPAHSQRDFSTPEPPQKAEAIIGFTGRSLTSGINNDFQPRLLQQQPMSGPSLHGNIATNLDLPLTPAYFANGPESTPQVSRHPLQYHLFAPPLPHASVHHPQQIALHNFFLSYSLREDLQRQMEDIVQGVGRGEGLEIGGFFGVQPLDAPSERPPKDGQPGSGSGFFGYRSWLYKGTNDKDGKCYALRRLENCRITQDNALQIVERWRRLRHPNIVGVREAFTTRAFGDSSVIFVFDYHPLANTLLDIHLTPKPLRGSGRLPQPPAPLNERVFWSYVVQLASAIRAAHTAGLAIRTLDPSKIIMTGKNRLRINCCSIFDVVRGDDAAISNLQQEDFFDLGKVLIALTSASPSAIHNLPRALDHIGRQYSPEVHKTILFLFSKPSTSKTIDEFFRLLGSRVAEEFEASQNQCDSLEAELMREVENGRLVRLLCRLGFINERPEFEHDPKWSESGDRYVIKLFRDYVFHQVDDRGRPLMDLSHVLTCLNKLDAGIDERLTLMSRDSQTCLVVSYREIRAAIEGATRDLRGTG